MQGLLNDKMNVEVVGQNFLATSPIAGVPEPDFVDVAVPVQAPAQAAASSSSPAQVATFYYTLDLVSYEMQLLWIPTCFYLIRG